VSDRRSTFFQDQRGAGVRVGLLIQPIIPAGWPASRCERSSLCYNRSRLARFWNPGWVTVLPLVGKRVATTTGADIQRRMKALRELRLIHGLAQTVIVVALALLALAALASLILSGDG
jgi:hypothetical protein